MLRYLCCIPILAVLQSRSTEGHVKNNLLMAFVVCRHGERTPSRDELSLVSVEKWENITSWSLEPETLTAAGKRRSYELGKFLRQRYGAQGLNLVSNIYNPLEIVVRTTAQDSTKMTAQVAMAAMYPPEKEQYWDNHLGTMWTPVPYTSGPYDLDPHQFFSSCYTYTYLLNEAKKTALKLKFSQFSDLYPILKEHTGKDFSEDPLLFKTFLDCLRSQESQKVSIPEWTMNISSRIEAAAQLAYRLYFNNDQMIKIGGGLLLNEFLEAGMNIRVRKPVKKLYLYILNDINVGAFMEASRAEGRPMIPDYGSVFALELYRSYVGLDYYVSPVYLAQAGGPGPEILKIKGCEKEVFCKFHKYWALTQDHAINEEEYYTFH